MNMQIVKCPNCNGQVQIDVSKEFGFCSYCGTKMIFSKDAPVNATQAYANNREAALSEIQKIINYYTPAFQNEAKAQSISNRLYNLKNTPYWAFYIVVGFMILAGSLCFIPLLLRIPNLWKLLSLFAGIALIAGGILLIFFTKNSIEKRKKEMDRLEYELVRLNQKIDNIYNGFPNCPIGIEYCTPDSLNTIYNYIRQGRAESIKEALNILISEMYGDEMRQIALDSMNIAQQQLDVSQQHLNVSQQNLRVSKQNLRVARQNLNVNTVNMLNNSFRK